MYFFLLPSYDPQFADLDYFLPKISLRTGPFLFLFNNLVYMDYTFCVVIIKKKEPGSPQLSEFKKFGF